jgi:uncharacterized membrane protein
VREAASVPAAGWEDGRLSDEDQAAGHHRFVGTTRLEAFSDGVFAIAITLLVLDLAIGGSGSPWARVVDGWPFYLAYAVSFMTIGAAWIAHTMITDRLATADLTLLRINLLLLLVVGVLPFPTRLVADSIEDLDGERLFVALYGITFLAMRLLLSALFRYARREQLFAPGTDTSSVATQSVWLVVVGYGVAILVGLVFPVVAVALYCAIAIALVIPADEVRRLFTRGR